MNLGCSPQGDLSLGQSDLNLGLWEILLWDRVI